MAQRYSGLSVTSEPCVTPTSIQGLLQGHKVPSKQFCTCASLCRQAKSPFSGQSLWDVVQDGLVGAMALLARAFDLAKILPDHPLHNLIREQVVHWHSLHSSEANKDTSPNSPTDSESRGRCTQCGKVDLKVHAVFRNVPDTMVCAAQG